MPLQASRLYRAFSFLKLIIMNIRVKLEVNTSQSFQEFDLEDLGVSQVDWDSMNDEERRQLIQEVVHDMQEQPYWVVDDFSADEF